ncbi:MAG: GNAT family N-acetyltransferase [Candidatus Hodarchaeales archaeon]|jgi:ribosomal protein S18 acetylase RimI-like enzyme
MPTLTKTSKRESVKLRRIFFRKDKKIEEKTETDIPKEKYKFLVMKMSWDQAIDAMKHIEKELNNDRANYLKKVRIRNFRPIEEAQKFILCYNRAFITAPDPYRSLTLEDVQHFNPETTFVAILYGKIVGFVFLVIEPLTKNGKTLGKQGVIAGVGVDPRYRLKRIAYLLAAKAAKYFADNDVIELVCEVYFENKVSYSFIRSFGFSHTGTIHF